MSRVETIERKRLLYRSGLGFWCVNHVLGCAHGCKYPCYAQLMAERYGRARDYADWRRPRLVARAAELLDDELRRKRQRPASVHLCLTTDPFMVGFPEVQEESLRLVEVLNRHGVTASLLTKGVYPAALADRSRFPLDNTHGISIVSLDDGFRRKWEPHAAPYAERLSAARRLHAAGRRVLAHLEPYPAPRVIAQPIAPLLEAVSFVDEIYFGPWNYNARVRTGDGDDGIYAGLAREVRAFCRKRGIACVAES